MKYLIVILSLVMLCGCHLSGYSQSVSLICYGDGETHEVATRNALRNALEQTYGAIVSSSTKIEDNDLISDEIASISRGCVEHYKELWFKDDTVKRVAIQVVVSANKIYSYVNNHGMSSDVDGASFAMNTRLTELKLENARLAMKHLMEELLSYSDKMYDYQISTEGPYPYGDNLAKVHVVVSCKANANTVTFYQIYQETLRAIIENLGSTKIHDSQKNASIANQMNKYDAIIKMYPELFCLQFRVKDNIGCTVTTSVGKSVEEPFNIPCDSLNVGKLLKNQESVFLKANGIKLMRNNDQNAKQKVFMFNNLCYRSDDRTIDGPADRNRRNMNKAHKPPERLTYGELNKLSYFDLDKHLPQPTLGETHGEFHFIMVYTMNQIERVNRINVVPGNE